MHDKSILNRLYSLEVHIYTGKIDQDCKYSRHIFLTWTQNHHQMEAILSGEKTGRVYRKFSPIRFHQALEARHRVHHSRDVSECIHQVVVSNSIGGFPEALSIYGIVVCHCHYRRSNVFIQGS